MFRATMSYWCCGPRWCCFVKVDSTDADNPCAVAEVNEGWDQDTAADVQGQDAIANVQGPNFADDVKGRDVAAEDIKDETNTFTVETCKEAQ